MEYIRAESKPKDGKLLAIGHSMGGILLYAMLSRRGKINFCHIIAPFTHCVPIACTSHGMLDSGFIWFEYHRSLIPY